MVLRCVYMKSLLAFITVPSLIQSQKLLVLTDRSMVIVTFCTLRHSQK